MKVDWPFKHPLSVPEDWLRPEPVFEGTVDLLSQEREDQNNHNNEDQN